MKSPFKSYTVTQGIVTKYLAPTANKDGRIEAEAWAGHLTVSYDHGLCVEENHMAAARMLANKYGWLNSENRLAQGCMPDDTGYMFVFVKSGG
jgi:hypothetical protein